MLVSVNEICFEIEQTFCAWILKLFIVYNQRQLPGKSKIYTARAKTAAMSKLLPKTLLWEIYRARVRSLHDYCAQSLVWRNMRVLYTTCTKSFLFEIVKQREVYALKLVVSFEKEVFEILLSKYLAFAKSTHDRFFSGRIPCYITHTNVAYKYSILTVIFLDWLISFLHAKLRDVLRETILLIPLLW